MNRLAETQITEIIRNSEDMQTARDQAVDIVEDLLVLAYISGRDEAGEMLGTAVRTAPSADEVMSSVYASTAGEDFARRIEKHVDAGDMAGVSRVINTEVHRVINEAIINEGRKLGATTKTWHTMEDERVRDPHVPLDGVTVPIDGEFVTWDGYSSPAPGRFPIPELNVNCRCWLTVS